ncbi:MAG: CaiB/BaiF CoA-transferase family protein [Pseudomonadota bacterium]
MGALSHLKVIDLSRVLAAPWASQMLADFGAQVIKIEHPDGGDDTRGWGPPYLTDSDGNPTTESAYFMSANRGKQSVCIDIATEAGQSHVRQLVSSADVFLENFKVGGLAKYGLDYESLAALNPQLIYCSVTGFGQTGPERHRPGYDALIQAMGGLMSITGAADVDGGEPQKVGVALTDIMTGLYATIGILTALTEREQSGLGQHIDLALLDVTAATLANQATNYLVGGMVPERIGNAHPSIVPYQVFAAADGHLMLAVGNDHQFRRLCDVLDLPALASDARFATNTDRVAHREDLVAMLAARFSERERDSWLTACAAANVPAGPINRIDEVFEHPQLQARGMRVNIPHPLNPDLQLPGNPIHMSRTPPQPSKPPPMLGEHTAAVLDTLQIDRTSG